MDALPVTEIESPSGEVQLKAARQVTVVVVLVAVAIASTWLAHLHVVAQSYHPVVRVASPDGLIYTAVHDARHERQDCGAANHRFLEPLKHVCKDCKVLVARCERQLDGVELALHEGKEKRLHVVQGPGVRMSIAGPAERAQANCEYIAGHMLRSGIRNAACLSPAQKEEAPLSDS